MVDPYFTSGVKLFAISIAVLSCRAVGDDKQYNQDEVDVIGSLCHVHNKPGRAYFTLRRYVANESIAVVCIRSLHCGCCHVILRVSMVQIRSSGLQDFRGRIL